MCTLYQCFHHNVWVFAVDRGVCNLKCGHITLCRVLVVDYAIRYVQVNAVIYRLSIEFCQNAR